MTTIPANIRLIDKPGGITSFDVIRRLRRESGIKKMGHAGTLDPMATGLMIIGVGEGTKKLSEYLKLDKVYEAEIWVGTRTNTGDIEGEILEKKEVEDLSKEEVSETLASLVGTITLPVSAYSAIKKDGVPFYKKARDAKARGEKLPEEELPVRDMVVFSAELNGDIKYDSAEKSVRVPAVFHVGSGTYIRSLAEEIGRRLGYPATLSELRRVRIGEFNIKDAETIHPATDGSRGVVLG